MKYIDTPREINSSALVDNGYSLSVQGYKTLLLKNQNFKSLESLLGKDIITGKEVGSLAYVGKSDYIFVRTKAIQSHLLILDVETSGTIEYIKPKDFDTYVGEDNLRTICQDDILFVTGGNVGEVAIAQQDFPRSLISSHIIKLTIRENPYYVFTFLKNTFSKEQANFSPKGAIRGLDTFDKEYLLKIKIPFPNGRNSNKVIEYIEELTKSVINIEKEIQVRHYQIFNLIQSELERNQKQHRFSYEFPTLADLKAQSRIDTNIYTPYFKSQEFKIKNYKYGYSPISSFDFEISRGQNLQITSIGKSIYSDKYHPSFYTLMLPKHLSKYGTIDTVEYLGNKKKLKTLKKGDLIFGAEGFEKGRSIVVLEEKTKTITNIHGITLHQKQGNITLSIFVKCFLDYLRSIGLIDLYAVGGNGGSLAMKYWEVMPFPNFPEDKQREIAKLYNNPRAVIKTDGLRVENFGSELKKFISQAGINELDKVRQSIKTIIDEVLDEIINDRPVNISFEFLGE